MTRYLGPPLHVRERCIGSDDGLLTRKAVQNRPKSEVAELAEAMSEQQV